jgi:transcriptional regulator with XRE-family HTH domain
MPGLVLTACPPRGIIRRVSEDNLSGESVGERLRRLRLERALSQRDLSAPGVSYAYISRIEAGARRPSVKALRMLAGKLGVTPEYLETGSELGGSETRELRLAEIELRLRLEGDVVIDELNELLADAVANVDEGAAVRARVALGFAASGRSDHAEAIRQLEAAIESELLNPATRPDVFITLGRAYAARGTPRAAAELFERALSELQAIAPDDRGARVRFSSYLSFALTDLGELQRARAVVLEAISESERSDDPYTRVRLYWSLGRLSIEQSKPLVALDSFRRAVALLEATDDTLHLARAHLNCTQALIDADDLGAAKYHVEQAEALLGPHPSHDDLVVVQLMKAMCAARAGEFAAAEEHAAAGLRLSAELPNEQGQLWWAIAEARSGSGDPAADEAFTKAVDLLHLHGTVREYTNVLRAYGRYLRDAGREHDALDVFERAANVASNLQGEPSTAEREL